MNINRVTQQIKEEALLVSYDLFVAVSGYESRSTYLASLDPNAITKVVFGFEEGSKNKQRVKNDAFYVKHQYESKTCSVKDGSSVVDYITKYIQGSSKAELSILIDYSSMSRILYSSIIHYLKFAKHDKKITVSFSYSKAAYVAPPELENSNYSFGPIPGFNSLSIPCNPTALIVGLGYEKRRASGLKEYFDAEETYLLYTRQKGAEEFYPLVLERNAELLKQVKLENIFEYPIDDMLYTKKVLQDICSTIKDDYRVVLAPCGPKPFTLIGLIVASELDGVDVWGISGHSGSTGVDRKADGKLVILTIEYC